MQQKIGNHVATNNHVINALIVILGYKSFAREKEFFYLGYNLEQWEGAKTELLARGLITKAGAVKPEVKNYWYGTIYGIGSKERTEQLRLKYFATELEKSLT